MRYFGIIGKPLQHSFSPTYFSEKFAREGISAQYARYELERIEDLPALLQETPFAGLNVTLPYKESVIPYLDELDDTARAIGAVNVIAFRNNKRIGYNTDALGFMQAIKPNLQTLKPSNSQTALVLGTGGAAKAVNYALQHLGITTDFASRDAQKGIPYEHLTASMISTYDIIVNCTPLGMSPNIETCPPIPYEGIHAGQLVFDVVYNPIKTLFLQQAEARGARIANGLGMLHGQAECAWQIWNTK